MQAKAPPLLYMMMVSKFNNDNNNIIVNVDQHDNHLLFVDDIDLCKLVHWYWKVFCNSVFEILLIEQDVKHAIQTNNVKPVNINFYLLSKTYIDKQIK